MPSSISMQPRIGRRTRRGATLLEISISAMVSGVLLSAAMATVGGVFQTRRIAAEKLDSAGLAQQLMAEILAAPYADPNQTDLAIGRESGESAATRAAFDDVDDYDAWTSLPPQSKDGASLNDYAGWRRTVTVEFVDPTDPATVVGGDAGLKRITIVVEAPDAETTTLVALRAAAGALEYTAGPSATYVTAAAAALRMGAMPRAASASGNLVNHAVD